MPGTPVIPRTERITFRDSATTTTKYANGHKPRTGDIVFPVGDASGLPGRRNYLVLEASKYKGGSVWVTVQPITDGNADRETRQAVGVVAGRFTLVRRGATS